MVIPVSWGVPLLINKCILKKVSVYTSLILIAKLDYLTSLNLGPTGSLEYTPRSHFREMILDF